MRPTLPPWKRWIIRAAYGLCVWGLGRHNTHYKLLAMRDKLDPRERRVWNQLMDECRIEGVSFTSHL